MPKLKVMLEEFHTAFDIKPDRELRLRLIREEKAEVIEAAQHLLKEFADLAYVLQAGVNEGLTMEEITADVGEISPLIIGAVDAFKPIMGEACRRVHASNMSKLDDNGKPIRRADGKVLKGPNYHCPDLTDLFI